MRARGAPTRAWHGGVVTSTPTFRGWPPAAFDFFARLELDNTRAFWQGNRSVYDEAVGAPFDALSDLVEGEFGPLRRFRPYRDVRFSKDKSPYKTNAGLWFQHRNASHGVGSETHGAGAGFYFHLEPGGSFVAGGIWMPPRQTLHAIRDALAARPTEFNRLVSAPAFKRRFGGLSEEAMLKRLPRGFDPGHPAERWLRYQSFTVSAPLADAQVQDAKLTERMEKDYRTMLPMVRWINRALGYPPAARR
jgi:uncharacterized protein (TIGR02453 family)